MSSTQSRRRFLVMSVGGFATLTGCSTTFLKGTADDPTPITLFNQRQTAVTVTLSIEHAHEPRSIFTKEFEIPTRDEWDYPERIEPGAYRFHVVADTIEKRYVWDIPETNEEGLDIMLLADDIEIVSWVN